MTRTVLTVMTALCLLADAAAAAEGEVLWQIGKTDRDFRDLTEVADVNAYPKMFPADVEFVVGKSDPQKDFSGIHPGPSDGWAGQRPHTFKIRFELGAAPAGAYELCIDLVDTHSQAAPTLRVAVNEKSVTLPLERGSGDVTLMSPDRGKPRALRLHLAPDELRPGANQVELRVESGSWLLYDSISLRKLPPDRLPAIELTVKPSIFFVEKEGRVLQQLRVSGTGVVSGDPVSVEVRAGVDKLGSFVLDRAVLGIVKGFVYAEPAASPRQLTITASVSSQTATTSITQALQRKWRIYVAPSTHTDIGYTDIQSRVIDLHNRNTDLALELCAEFPLYHWNLESSWAAQMWWRDRPPYRHEELVAAARGKRVGIESGYLNMLTGLCSEEEIIRNLYYSARVHRESGVPFESHTLTDAPSHVWTVPSILAGAGIRCLSVGVNQTRAPLFKKNIHHKSPFWWEGPDGSRVLTWFTAGYSQAGQIGLREGLERMTAAVEADLYWWDHREDYPYDAVLLHGAYSDNVAIGRDIAESITAYSNRYAYPKVILCANNDFFEYIEKSFADKLPTVRGCGGSWWEDGAASSAVETAINRVAHQDVIAAEAAWGAASAHGAPLSAGVQEDFNRVWDNILLYDEHTWGAHNSISEPTSDFVQRQWAVKAAYATDAADRAGRLLESGLRELGSRVGVADGSLLVFNPSGRARSGVVHASIPRGSVIMDDAGVVPQQVVFVEALRNVRVAFVARDVPAVGYRTYRVAPESGPPTLPPKRFDGTALENEFYRVQFDPESGGIASVTDKKLGKELVDQASPYKLGRLIYAAGGGEDGRTQVNCPNPTGVTFTSPGGGSIKESTHGPVFSSVKSLSRHELFHHVEMETILYEHERRVDFVFRLNKKMTYNQEAIYLAFPIAGKNPRFRYEIGGGSVRPNEDHFPGACRDWFAVQRWVTVQSDDAPAVAWSPLDTPLITLCDLTPGKWLDELPITNGTVFAYTMNNYWFTNYKAGQDGTMTFRYAMTSAEAIDPASASLFGESAAAPLRAITVHPAKGGGSPLPPTAGFCRVEPQTVTLTTLKPADDGKGLIVRIREMSGKPADVKITCELGRITKASQCDLVERVRGPLPLAGGQVALHLAPNAMTTVRLE